MKKEDILEHAFDLWMKKYGVTPKSPKHKRFIAVFSFFLWVSGDVDGARHQWLFKR